ncbi:hypothetical protein PCE1_000929 [Barthelona sp. PCE]
MTMLLLESKPRSKYDLKNIAGWFTIVVIILCVFVMIWSSLRHNHIYSKEYLRFLDEYPGYGYSQLSSGLYLIDTVRQELFHNLKSYVYLDNTASLMAPTDNFDHSLHFFKTHFLANPHSAVGNSISPSTKTDAEVDVTREKIAKMFGINTKNYTIAFTSGATGALHLIGESFNWTNNSLFIVCRFNHLSVIGIRELAKDRGAAYIALLPDEILPFLTANATNYDTILVGMPVASNFDGSLWLEDFFAPLRQFSNVNVLADVAAYVPSHKLDISTFPADFFAVSFYKMVGYPTGVGVMICNTNVANRALRKRYFGGGTVKFVNPQTDDIVFSKSTPYRRWEDGTINFYDAAALSIGIDHFNWLGVDRINNHTFSLADYTRDILGNLVHSNGSPMVYLYKSPSSNPRQASIISFQVLNKTGYAVDPKIVNDALLDNYIVTRKGAHCNYGSALYFNNEWDGLCTKPRTHEFPGVRGGCPFGVVRVSIGAYNTFNDVRIMLVTLEKEFKQ